MLEHLENLCELCGVSGREHAVRDYIQNALTASGIKTETDALGNLLVRRSKNAGTKIALFAHMDEVGYFLRYITEDGLLKVSSVGGVEVPASLGSRMIVGDGAIQGVFGAKPIHLLSESEKSKPPAADSLYIDIGAESRKDAEKNLCVGDWIAFARQYKKTGDTIMSPALDDRAGCAVLLDILLHSGLSFDAAFTVQEEVGTRGAQTAAYALEPETAIILEATTAADLPNTADGKRVCELGEGAVLSFMDGSTIYDKELFDSALRLAKENGVAAQIKSMISGGNDAAAIHKSRAGVRTLAISVPCRYLHSPCAKIAQCDLLAVRDLAAMLIRSTT